MIERMRRLRRSFFSSLYEHMHPFFRDTLYLMAQLFGHVEISLLAGLLRQTLELIDIPVPIVFERKPDFLFKNKNSSLHQIVCLLKWLRNAPTKNKFWSDCKYSMKIYVFCDTLALLQFYREPAVSVELAQSPGLIHTSNR